MMQIGTIGRVGTVRATVRPQAPEPREPARPAEPSRALVAIAGGRAEAPEDAATQKARGGTRPLAGFLTQMIVESDPTLRPSRLERTGIAAARYAETARLTA
ncbi:hypothetical protein ACFZ8E_00165 [Methylobacterium sp. HMF5984]|uniref:hypothetical protein n=1 Tax=unclassified Methylobacterium TaxID=2615210 RepID=UPI001FBA1674|nr:hypothetical protein [Methylobacterium sp. E-025]MCJ2110991.1 hypothetical protein [Methylobacterium sp. E-025]